MNNIYYNQAELMSEVVGFMDWDACFALKGGTAINFFYENMPNWSLMPFANLQEMPAVKWKLWLSKIICR